ncbi:MAG: HTTM domain-containing protein [Myxococcales bacterium]|nr:HTTM domain-containing protein [Myxococcales bacterium]
MAKKKGKKPAKTAPSATTEKPADKTAPSIDSAPPAAVRRDPAKRGLAIAKPRAAEPPPEPPAFWFGFDVAWAKLLAFRLVFFGLLALDALLQLRHAPRYGAGGFNVAQLPLLDGLGPTRVLYAIAQLVCAYLFVLAALGVATRIAVPLVAAIYAWLYFGSQLDGYQHHYLVALLLGIACFVPWQRPAEAGHATTVRTWAVRLVLVQLGILYLWAAISKLDAAWLDGSTLSVQIQGSVRELIDDTVGIKLVARLTILAELVLAVAIWVRPAWFVALPLGVAFHVGILMSNLEIGLFAYLMLAMYLLVIPDRAYVWLAERRPLEVLRRLFAPSATRDLLVGLVTLSGIAIATTLVALMCRLPFSLGVALGLGLVPLALVAHRRLRGRPGGAAIGAAHLVALALWVLVDRTTSVSVDYYRFWGGSSRRLGDAEAAERAYRKMVALAPDEGSGHFQLGRLLLKRGEEREGLEELRRAQELETARARAYVAEAQYLAGKGRTAEALAKAEEATYAEPTDQTALDLVDQLSGKKRPPAGAGSGASDDDQDQR